MNTIQNQLRDSDILVRWGGEEFILFCSDTSAHQATILAKRIVAALDKQPFEPVPFTVSAGVAQYAASESKEQWFKRADIALYQAKSQGRNRIEQAAMAKDV